MSVIRGKKNSNPWADDDDEDRKMRKLFVDKLNSSITEQHIIDVFSKFGEIEEVAKYQDRRAPSRYFAFVVYKHARDCEKATRNPCPVIRNKKCECMLAAIGKQFSGYKFFVKKGLLTEEQDKPICVNGKGAKHKRTRKHNRKSKHRADNSGKEQHHHQLALQHPQHPQHPHNAHIQPYQHHQHQHQHQHPQQMQYVQDVPGLAPQAIDTSLDSQRSAVTAYSGHGLDDAGNHQPPFNNTPSAYGSYRSQHTVISNVAIQHQPAFGHSQSNPHRHRFNHNNQRQQPHFTKPQFSNVGAHSYNMSPRSPYAQQQSAHSRNGHYAGQAQPYAQTQSQALLHQQRQHQMRWNANVNAHSLSPRGRLFLEQSRPSMEGIANDIPSLGSPVSYHLSNTPSMQRNASNTSYYSPQGGLAMRAPPSSCPQHQPLQHQPLQYQHQHRNLSRLQHYHPHQNALPQISSSHSLYPPVPGCVPGSVSPQPPSEAATVPAMVRSQSYGHTADRSLSDSGSDSSSSRPSLAMMPRSAHCTVGAGSIARASPKKTRTRAEVDAVDTVSPLLRRAMSTGVLDLGLPEDVCITAPDLLPEDLPNVSDCEWTPPPSLTPNSGEFETSRLKLNLQDSSSKPLPAPLTLQQAQKASDEALADHLQDAGFNMISDNYSDDDDLDEDEDEEEDDEENEEIAEAVDNSDEVDHNEMKEINLSGSGSEDDIQDIE